MILDNQLNHARAKRMVFCVVGEHAVVAAAAAGKEEAAQTLRCTGDGGHWGEALGDFDTRYQGMEAAGRAVSCACKGLKSWLTQQREKEFEIEADGCP